MKTIIEKYIEDIDTRIEYRKNSIDQWFDALAFLLRDYKDGKKNKLQTLIEAKNIIGAIEARSNENDELIAIQSMLIRMNQEVKGNNQYEVQ